MSSMTVAQGRVIDPVLSTVAQGFKHADRVGMTLFPAIDVNERGGTTLEFGRESFRLYTVRRAPGASTAKVPFGYAGKPFSLVQDALNSSIPRELLGDAAKVPGIDLGKRSTRSVMFSLTLSLEAEQAALATDANNYNNDRKITLAGSDIWDDPASDPLKHIDDAKEAVRNSAGIEPNRMVIPNKAFKALRRNNKIAEKFKYTSADSITTEMLAAYFDLDMLSVAKAKFLDGTGENEKFKDVWGNSAVLAYVPPAPEGFEEPSFGYTYTLKGHPFVEQPFWDNDVKSWVYGVTYERVPLLTGIASGFLFQNVCAAG